MACLLELFLRIATDSRLARRAALEAAVKAALVELPPLPDYLYGDEQGYDAEQMQAYAREAIRSLATRNAELQVEIAELEPKARRC